MGERIHRSVMNIKVGMLFYLLSLPLAFFSRKVFLDCLGAEFIGLTGMLTNIMSYLSVAELGISLSIAYFLYKPLQEDDHEKINEIMSMLAYLYRCIGFVIGALGFVTSLFFPWWFDNLSCGLFLVYFAFYSFLASSMAGYIFNYKNILVGANQKQYLVSAYFQSISIAQSIVQIILAYYYRNLYLWVVVGFVFTVIGIILFNYRIRQLYPWLRINIAEGRKNLKNYPDILKKTRQILARKLKDLILYRSDDVFVGSFVSVTAVAFYSNYTMITYKLIYLLNILSDGFSAGIGNLLAEGNEKNIMKVFWEMTAFRFLIIGKPDIIRTAEAAELRFGSCVKYAFPENGLVFVNGLRVLDIVRDKVVPHLHKFKARHDGSGIAVGIGVVPVVQEEEGDLNLGDCDLLTVRIGVGDRGLGIHPILHKVVEVYKIICHQLAIQVIVETAGKHSAL